MTYTCIFTIASLKIRSFIVTPFVFAFWQTWYPISCKGKANTDKWRRTSQGEYIYKKVIDVYIYRIVFTIILHLINSTINYWFMCQCYSSKLPITTSCSQEWKYRGEFNTVDMSWKRNTDLFYIHIQWPRRIASYVRWDVV